MNVPANFLYQGFFNLLCDALYQCRRGAQCSDSYEMNRHARASISASTLCLESFANCLLSSAPIPSSLANDLDKAGALAKIDCALRVRGLGGIERGRAETQAIAEFLKIRNQYVHPKSVNINTTVGKPEDRGENATIPFQMDGERWERSGIPKRPLFWSPADAKAVLEKLLSFLSYVISEQMGMSSTEARELLSSRLEIGEHHMLGMFDEFVEEMRAAKSEGLDASFLGFDDE